MDDPQQAVDHARTLAPDVVIFEHSPSSEWVFYAAEEKRCLGALRHWRASISDAIGMFIPHKLSRITLNSLPS
jgi:hypothetical protein